MGSNTTYYVAVATAVLREARQSKPECPGGAHLYEIIQQEMAGLVQIYKDTNPGFNELEFKANVLQRIAEGLESEVVLRGEKDDTE